MVSRQLELLHITRSLLFDVIAAVEKCDDSEDKAAIRYHVKVTVDKIAESLQYVEECRALSTNVVLCMLHVYSRVCGGRHSTGTCKITVLRSPLVLQRGEVGRSAGRLASSFTIVALLAHIRDRVFF